VTSVPGHGLPDQGPAARRPRRPAAERRRQILAAARALFAERGFHATTTRDLAAAADINDALIYRYFPDKQAILTALADEAIAVFQALPKPPDQAPLPLDQLLELIGTGFVHTARANLDLVTILIGERHALTGDTRFAQFIDDAATRLGRLIDATAHGHSGAEAGGKGYLTARGYFGALIAFVLLQDQLGMTSIRPVDTAEYIHHLAQLTIHGTGLPRQTGIAPSLASWSAQPGPAPGRPPDPSRPAASASGARIRHASVTSSVSRWTPTAASRSSTSGQPS
jgi:AcrR family transcriptional regulator